MEIILQNYRIILDQVDKDLKKASGSQKSDPERYAKAQERYVIAHNAFIEAMNTFCETSPFFQSSKIQFEIIEKANQYNT